MLRRYRPYMVYLRPHLPLFWAAMAAAAVYAVATGFGIAYILKQVLPSLFEPDAEQLPLATLLGLASLIPLAFLVRGVSGWLHVYGINAVGMRTLEGLRNGLFEKLQRLQLSFVRTRQTGDLLSRLSNDTQVVQTTLTTVASDVVKQPLTLVAARSYLVYESVVNSDIIFLLAAVAAVPLCILPVRYLGRRLLKRAREQQQQTGELTGVLAENLNGALEVRAFGQEGAQQRVFGERLRTLVRTQLKVVRYQHALNPSIEFISAAGVAAAFVTAYLKGVSLEAFVALMPALYFSYEPIKRIGGIHMNIQKGLGALERLDEIMAEPETIQNPPAERTADPAGLRGRISFEGVAFHYEETPVLSDLSLAIEPGTFTAIVGPSGAGKSSFINLIPRFYQPTQGRILIGDKDLRDYRLDDLRRAIAIVPQDPFLFRDTLLNNIRVGRPEASFEEVQAAARQAHIHDFIEQMPLGYETQAGERGSQLSGGQRQRIALARAFLRDAPILILDEATSALDSESEQNIQAALERLVVGKTVFVVAHRFSTIRQADRVLLFENGRITADGSIDALMEHPTFRRLHESQLLRT